MRRGLFILALGFLVPAVMGTTALAQKTVSLSFDDGLAVDTAVDGYLTAAGMHGTFYIISSTSTAIGTSGYMTLAQIKTLQAHGHEIGGHTITHPFLTTLTPAQQQHEVCDGRAQLMADGLTPVVSFAYPDGDSNSTTEGIVKACGFTSGRGAWCNNSLSNGACNETIPPGDSYWIQTPQAIAAHPTEPGDVPNADVTSMQNYVTFANDGDWIVYQFHYVCPDADATCNQQEYSVKASVFTSFLSGLQSQIDSGAVVVKTVGEVMGGFPAASSTPAISNLSPISATVGGPAFTLTVTGANFINTSVVQWNGAARTTTFVNSTTLTAAIPATDLTTAGTKTLTVSNGTGAVSPGISFTVGNPVPTLASLSSTSALVGSPQLTLTVTGTNFIAGSVVRWNGTAVTTAFVNSTTLNATIPAADLATVKVDSVTVFNTSPGGGTSGTKPFTVFSPVPVLTALSSNSAVAGSPAFTLTATGSNFVSGSVVQWNGSARTTSFVNSTTLTAQITASDLSTVKTVNVTVFNLAPGGGTSSAQLFTVGNAVPTLSSLSPSSALLSSSPLTLTLTGTNFVSASAVSLNGSARTTTFVNATTLSIQISANDLSSAGLISVAVANPTPGGGTSGVKSFTVNNPTPMLTAISPSSARAGQAAFTLTVTGSHFVNNSTILWNGSARTTLFVSTTTLTASIPASDTVSVGTATIAVFTSAPGGGTSNALPLSISFSAPGLTSIDPAFVTTGGPSFTLTARGNFASGSILEWNGAPLSMISASNTTLSATVPASDILATGNASVTVFTPPPGGGTSTALQVNISAASGGGASVNVVSPRVYPNPWRTDRPNNGYVTFDQMPDNSTVKIFTISAHEVKTLDAPAGTVRWYLQNDSGDNVASGYYIYLITGPGVKVHGTFAIIR